MPTPAILRSFNEVAATGSGKMRELLRSAGDTDDIVDSNMHDELLKNDGLYHGL